MAIISILAALLLIGFLSGVETAFFSSNKLSIELKKKQGTFSGKTWGEYNEHPTRFIGTLMLGFNLVLVVYGFLIGDILRPIWNAIKNYLHDYVSPSNIDFVRFLVETFLATTIILFFEFMSRAIFRSRSNTIVNSGIISHITRFFYRIFSSQAEWFIGMAEWILKYIFNVKLRNKNATFTKYDLEHFLNQRANNETAESVAINKTLFEKALSFSEIKLRKCMIPRKEIEGIEINTEMVKVKERFIETQLSKMLVYEGSIDNITGYVHHLDLLQQPDSLRSIQHPIPVVPESMSAADLMSKFSKERKSIAWVIDEFGGTAGIVSMEDLLEELFGEIEDEYDVPEALIEKQLAPAEFIFSGRLELDYLKTKYKIRFDKTDHAETLSGYIIQHHEAIPKLKESISIGDWEFDIMSVGDTRIETVKMKMLK